LSSDKAWQSITSLSVLVRLLMLGQEHS